MQNLVSPLTSHRAKLARALADLSILLMYPDDQLVSHAHRWRNTYAGLCAAADSAIAHFGDEAGSCATSRLEELFTRTFDLAPICNPYITAHLYGAENFERGTLMSKLSDRYREENYDLAGELPDHLRVILGFTPLMSDDELQEITHYCLLEPVKEMRDALDDGNPYRHLLDAIFCLLESI